MTKARKAVLKVLQEAKWPLTAGEISMLVEIPCDPVTIYRNLHQLEDQGYADSFVLHCSEHGTERYYTGLRDGEDSVKHHHWFHCERCHAFIDLGDCRMNPLLESYSAELGIRITGHTLYVTGTCPSCQETH
ncbi:MAG: transcriptional repressor [Sphaerochaetaceae bacterium]